MPIKSTFIILIICLFNTSLIGQSDWKKIEKLHLTNQIVNSYAITFDNGKAYLDNNPLWYYSDKKNSSNKEDETLLMDNLYSLNLSANFNMLYVWIYNEAGVDTFFFVDSNYFSANLPQGIYSVFTGYFHSSHGHTILVNDSILLNTSTNLKLLKEDAIYTANYQFTRENGEAMRINSMGVYFFNGLINDKSFRLTITGIDSVACLIKFNKIPDYFYGEWAIKGKQARNGGNLYLLNNELPVEEKDTVVTNDPVHFAHADFYYHVPDSIETHQRDIQITTHMPEFHYWGPGDPIYRAPVQMRVFQDTTADFSLMTSIFFQTLYSWPGSGDGITYITTPEIRIKSAYVEGYFYRDRHATSFVISENVEKVHWGLTPTYWFGKFFNQSDTIKIGSPYGYWDQLFLAQGNDVLAHYPIDYVLFNNGIRVRDGQFIPLTYWYPHMLFGFHPDSLNIPVTTGEYEIIITDDQCEVASYPGVSQVKAGFDLAQSDKDPPNIVLFQILSNDEIANVLDSSQNNLVRFILEEEEGISQMQLFYAVLDDTIWHELTLSYNTPYWETQIPPLTQGYYSLKLYAVDLQNNYIECQMAPAFWMQEAMDIPGGETVNLLEGFQLFQNYPNPFNSGTVISYQVPERFRGKMEISVYTVLGQKVRTLFNGTTLPGIQKIIWDGRDETSTQRSSGIYIFELKGGENIIRKKMLLIK